MDKEIMEMSKLYEGLDYHGEKEAFSDKTEDLESHTKLHKDSIRMLKMLFERVPEPTNLVAMPQVMALIKKLEQKITYGD